MPTDLATVLADLTAEGGALDELVAGLPAARWAEPTPADGWTIAHQISHLAWTDRLTVQAATDPAAFQEEFRQVVGSAGDLGGYVDAGAEEGTREAPDQLLARWRHGREQVRDALTAVPAGTRVPWIVGTMTPTSMATARLMETWAHGLDVADALGAARKPTARLRHVAHIGVRARDFAFAVNGRPAPAEPFRVELTPPDGGEPWTWGPADATQRVIGPALDFCLLATQRRNRADLALTVTGQDADAWLDVAQAFAGLPGTGRAPSEQAG